MLRRLTSLRQRGDTLVEVLIAITIISLILGGAYVVSNNSLRATLDSQEHNEALQLAQSQLEQVKGIVNGGGTGIFPGPGTPFCITTAGVPGTGGVCNFNSAGGTPITGQPVFTISICQSTTSALGAACNPTTNGTVFTVSAKWPSAIGTQTDQEQIVYRLYKLP